MTDDLDRTRYMPRYNIVSGAARYVGYNAEMHAVEKNSPHMLMRYEDLVIEPEAKMREALNLIGLPDADTCDLSNFLGSEGVKLGVNHTIAGNPMRHESGWIALRPDNSWREKMPKHKQLTIAALTLPLLKKYGYDVLPSK